MAVKRRVPAVTGGVRQRSGRAQVTPFVPRRARPRPRAGHSLGLQQLGVGDALQPVGQQLEGAALWQQHEQAIQGLDQVRVVLHVQQLQAQVCGREGRGSGRL